MPDEPHGVGQRGYVADQRENAEDDAPDEHELVIAVAVTDGGRPLPRVGGLEVPDIVGEDGLR